MTCFEYNKITKNISSSFFLFAKFQVQPVARRIFDLCVHGIMLGQGS